MAISSEEVLKIIRQVQILLAFQRFAERIKDNPNDRLTYLNSLTTPNKNATIKNIFKREYDFELENSECEYMFKLVNACLKKTNRTPPSIELRRSLLEKQSYKCAFCGAPITMSSHVDHIVPFKYVGDELEDNYQILCDHCNHEKKDSLTYQIEIILRNGTKIS